MFQTVNHLKEGNLFLMLFLKLRVATSRTTTRAAAMTQAAVLSDSGPGGGLGGVTRLQKMQSLTSSSGV